MFYEFCCLQLNYEYHETFVHMKCFSDIVLYCMLLYNINFDAIQNGV